MAKPLSNANTHMHAHAHTLLSSKVRMGFFFVFFWKPQTHTLPQTKLDMAGVLSMLRDVIRFLRVLVKLDRSLLDTKRCWLSLDQHHHLCVSLMFYPTLSRMFGCEWRCVVGFMFMYAFDGVACVQSSLNMCVWTLLPMC